MKVIELFETKRQMGKYQLPYSHPNRSHRGLWSLYNHVWPELAKALGVPARNLKLDAWSSERGSFSIKISNPKTEVDMVELMAPKALKGILEKQGFRDVNTKLVGIVTLVTDSGKEYPVVSVLFTTKYPQKWIEYDEQRFGKDLAKVTG